MQSDEPEQRNDSFIEAMQIPNVSITVRSLISFRLKYLGIAEAAASSLTSLESEEVGIRWYNESFQRATVAVIFSYSAAEAAMNEALRDLDIRDPLYSIVERQSPIDQAQTIAAILNFEAFSPGEEPVTSMSLLKAVRDGLVHAKAEWSDDQASHTKLSKRILSAGIPLSPFAKSSDRVFPIACMSAGLATWATRTARSFIYNFYARAGLPQSG